MADENEKKDNSGHSTTDHTMGLNWAHIHFEDADHDHDDFEFDGPIEENPLWIQDNVTLTSVGIDIGIVIHQ